MDRNIRLCFGAFLTILVVFDRFDTIVCQNGLCPDDQLYPMMSLQYASNAQNEGNKTAHIDNKCAAVVLNHNWLLTLASCVDSENPSRYSFKQTPSTQSIYVKNIYINPKYNKELGTGYDLALLNVENRIVMNEDCFPLLTSKNNYDDKACIIKKPVKDPNTNVYKFVPFPAQSFPQNACNYNAMNFLDDETKNKIQCAETIGAQNQKGVCQGEEGSILLCRELGTSQDKYRLRGISSWGDVRCQVSQYPFTKIGEYDSWIKKYIN